MNGSELISKIAGAAHSPFSGKPLPWDGPRRPQKRHLTPEGKLTQRGENLRGSFRRNRHFALNRPSPGHARYVIGADGVQRGNGYWPQ